MPTSRAVERHLCLHVIMHSCMHKCRVICNGWGHRSRFHVHVHFFTFTFSRSRSFYRSFYNVVRYGQPTLCLQWKWEKRWRVNIHTPRSYTGRHQKLYKTISIKRSFFILFFKFHCDSLNFPALLISIWTTSTSKVCIYAHH